MTSRDPHTPTDDVILDHAPILPAQPKLALLDEASILRVSNCTDLSNVKVWEHFLKSLKKFVLFLIGSLSPWQPPDSIPSVVVSVVPHTLPRPQPHNSHTLVQRDPHSRGLS